MDGAIGWYASISGIIAAIIIAGDFGRRATAFAFIIFVTSSIAWITAASIEFNQTVLWQNIVMLLTNLVGVYRWGRKARQAVKENQSDEQSIKGGPSSDPTAV